MRRAKTILLILVAGLLVYVTAKLIAEALCVRRMRQLWSLAASEYAVFRANHSAAESVGVHLTDEFDEESLSPVALGAAARGHANCPLGGVYEPFALWRGPTCPHGHAFNKSRWFITVIAKKVHGPERMSDALRDASPTVRYKAIALAKKQSALDRQAIAALEMLAEDDPHPDLRKLAGSVLQSQSDRER